MTKPRLKDSRLSTAMMQPPPATRTTDSQLLSSLVEDEQRTQRQRNHRPPRHPWTIPPVAIHQTYCEWNNGCPEHYLGYAEGGVWVHRCVCCLDTRNLNTCDTVLICVSDAEHWVGRSDDIYLLQHCGCLPGIRSLDGLHTGLCVLAID